jgi:hypothetical protein
MFEDEDCISLDELAALDAETRAVRLADPELEVDGSRYYADLSRGLEAEEDDEGGESETGDDEPPIRANDDGTITFVASTEQLDRYNSRFSGWSLAAFRRNPIFIENHRVWGSAKTLGAVKKILVDDKQRLLADVRFDESPLNPEGQLAAHQYRQGFRFAVSIRARAKRRTWMGDLEKSHRFYNPKGGVLYEDNDLLELSSVLIPGNSYAVKKRSLDGLGRHLPDYLKRLSPDGDLDGLARTLGTVLVRALIEQPDSETARSFRSLIEAAGSPIPTTPAPAPDPTRQASAWSWLTDPTPAA